MTSLKRSICRVLILAMLALSFQAAQAGMIGTEQAIAAGVAAPQRALVMDILQRADTAAQLQALGIDPALARERVASMTDQEVRQLAGDMQAAPAGGSDGATVVIVLLVIGLIWFFAFRM